MDQNPLFRCYWSLGILKNEIFMIQCWFFWTNLMKKCWVCPFLKCLRLIQSLIPADSHYLRRVPPILDVSGIILPIVIIKNSLHYPFTNPHSPISEAYSVYQQFNTPIIVSAVIPDSWTTISRNTDCGSSHHEIHEIPPGWGPSSWTLSWCQ